MTLLELADLYKHYGSYYECNVQPIYSYILGILLCIGGMVSYIPQYYYLIKTKNHKGISDKSLFFLNMGSFCLFSNALILNWWKFSCYGKCSTALCTANLESVFQIGVGCIAPFPLYLLFVKYRIRNSLMQMRDRNIYKRIVYILLYVGIYIVFVMLMIIVGLVEKMSNPNSWSIFEVAAKIFGILAAVCFSIVWLPQIIQLIKTKRQGNLSLAMFLIQTPGNAIIIMFQVLYKQNWTTWFAYVITLAEQLTIVIILFVYKCRQRNTEQIVLLNNDDVNDDTNDDTNNYTNTHDISIYNHDSMWEEANLINYDYA